MRLSRPAAISFAVLALAGCAPHVPPQASASRPAPVPPPADTRPRADEFSKYDQPRCPPTPPPPSSATPVCGNGKAEDVYGLIAAPCIPGRCCASGWVPTSESEQCDGADLRGQSCKSLGFVSGTLRCAPDCKLDKSDCAQSAEPGAKVDQVPGGPQCTSGHFPALARRGAILGVAYPNGTAVAFAGYDLSAGLRKVASGNLLVGGGYDQDALREWASPHGPRTTAGTAVIAPFGDGFLGAVQRYGDDTSTAVFRIRSDGKMEGPIAKVPGRPLFLVPGKEGALLGFEGNGMGLQILGADGGAVGKPMIFGQRPAYYGQLQASAQPTDDGWIVASGSAGQPLPIEAVTLSARGALSPVRRLAEKGMTVLLARGRPTQAVFNREDGVFAVDALAGPAARQIYEGRAFQLLDAESGPDGLTVWIESKVAPTGAGTVSRLVASASGATAVQDVVSVPLSRPCAATSSEGTLYLWFGDENNRTPPALFRGR